MRKPALPAAPLPPPEPTETAPLPEPVDVGHLQGLDENAAQDWLGQPKERLEAPPAKIWRYVTPDCELDVYFYLDLQARLMRALHYEVRSHDTSDRRDERCFEQLVTDHRQREGNAPAAYRPR